MLPKPERLNLKKDFKWVAAGKKLETKYLKIFVKPGSNKTARVGIAVSTKNFKKAVDRNRARRLTSAAFETLYTKLPGTINIVALPKSGISNVKSDLVYSDLAAALRNEKIID